jgi:hypothetical protein
MGAVEPELKGRSWKPSSLAPAAGRTSNRAAGAGVVAKERSVAVNTGPPGRSSGSPSPEAHAARSDPAAGKT